MGDEEKEKNKAEAGLEKEESRNKRPEALGTERYEFQWCRQDSVLR